MSDWHKAAGDDPVKHISERAMGSYILGGLSEMEQGELENHLFACDSCLAVYMEALETEPSFSLNDASQAESGCIPEEEEAEPRLPDMEQIAASVIGRLEREQERERPDIAAYSSAADRTAIADSRSKGRTRHTVPKGARRTGKWLQRPGAQFGLAAAVTLLLIGTGALGGLSERLASFDRHSAAELSRPPAASSGEAWSERILDRTVSWLDGIEAERFK